ncbi:MAG TPA: D-erythronate dehydrogenase [Mesorhizobium sp.]
MHVMIIGAAGMIGRKLAARLAKSAAIGSSTVDQMTLVDVIPSPAPSAEFGADIRVADLSMPGEAERLIASRPDTIFHLAAIVSGEAEADFEKGYRVNLDGTRLLFEAIRKIGRGQAYRPRVVFSSSIAAFGGSFPDEIEDDFITTPATSYGTQKVIGELLLADYSRRNLLDGIGIRLPTICIRPGKPNKAASSFFSGILREPLIGEEAVLPVSEELRHWFASPRAAIAFLEHAATIDLSALGVRRSLTMPGLSVSVGEQIEALRQFAGDKAVRLIRREPDEAIARIVAGWPSKFNARRAEDLGFRADASFADIVRAHIEDELGGRV